MYCINKLSVLGIRSFGPDKKENIEFERPLTLLVGPNGAGKTTIIECLKYATTGAKKSGFVHDLNLSQKDQVQAKVSLEIQNLKGKKILVKRNLKSTRNGDKISENITDVVIATERDGQWVPFASKQSDVNEQMEKTLSVSDAVLNYVIFCHQEDSTWPMEGGKPLKEKFDDLFAVDRYANALDNISEIQKDYKKKAEYGKIELESRKNNYEKVKSLKQDETKNERKLEEAKKNLEETKANLIPINQKKQKLLENLSTLGEMDRKLEGLKSQQKQMLEEKKNLEKRTKIFNATEEQLEVKKMKQTQALDEKQSSLKLCIKDVNPLLNNDLGNLIDEKNKLLIQQGTLENEFENAAAKKCTRSKLMHECKKLYNLNMPDMVQDEINEEQVEEFTDVFQDFVNKQNESLESHKANLTDKEEQLDKSLEEIRQKITKKSERYKLKHEQLEKQELKHDEVKKKLADLEESSDSQKLNLLEEKQETANAKLKVLETSFDTASVQCKIDQLSSKKSELNDEIIIIEGEIEEIQKHTKTRSRVEIKQEEIRKKEDSIRVTQEKHCKILQEVGIMSSASPMFPNTSTISEWFNQMEEEIKNVQKNLDIKKSEETELLTKRKGVDQELNNKLNELHELQKSNSSICGSQDFESSLVQLKTEIKDLQEGIGLADGKQFIYKMFLRKLKPKGQHKKTDIPCPMCQRPFGEASEVDQLIEKLQKDLEDIPRSSTIELSRKINNCKILEDNISKQTEMDEKIPKLRASLVTFDQNIKAASEDKNALDDELARLKADKRKLESCQVDVGRVENLQKDIKSLSKDLHELQSLVSESSPKTSEEANAEKAKLYQDLKTVTHELESNRRRDEKHTKLINDHNKEVNSIQSEILHLESTRQRYQELQRKQISFSEDIPQINSEIVELETSLVPLQRKEEQKEAEKSKIITSNKEWFDKANQRLLDVKSDMEKFMNLQNDVERYTDKESELQKIMESIRKLEAIEKLQQEITRCKTCLRDIEDNISLWDKRLNIKKVKKEIEKLKTDIDELDALNIKTAISDLKTQCELLKQKEQSLTTEKAICEDRLSTIRKNLDSEINKNAEANYRQCFVDWVFDDIVSKDLLKCHEALNHSIIHLHKMKMNQINEIIRDLWQKTYTGKDIHNIKIRDDSTPGLGTSSRRVFNYRVVMCLEDTEMDMKGRCSAGQKVMASLVIRLALAETFCTNCGILALDEPTTNLDRDNIDNLAESLINIIEARSNQPNFQLLVITHDNYFVEQLAKSPFANSLLRVTKDEQGMTKVAQSRICDLDL